MKSTRVTKLLILFYWMSMSLSQAQQSIALNQSAYNLFLLNPAASGLYNELNVNCHYKKNWMGLSESPELIAVSVDGSLLKDKNGLGLFVMNETAGIFSKTYLTGSYRYKIKLSKENYILFGISLGFQKQQCDFSKLKADSPEEFALWPQQQAVTVPDASLGFIYTYKKLFLSASTFQILKQDFNYKEPVYNKVVTYQTVPYFLFCIQNTFHLKSEQWKYIPNLTLRTTQGLPVQFELLNTFHYRDKVLLGIGYRYLYAIYLNMGYSITDHLRVIYSYEYSLGIQTLTKGGHEIGIRFGILDAKRKTQNSISTSEKEKLDEIYNQLDKQDIQIVDLTKKVDSLDQNVNALKSQIEYLKSQQLNLSEVKITLNDYLKNSQVDSTNKNNVQSNVVRINTAVSVVEKYKMIRPQSDSDIDTSRNTTHSNYKIVLGVYQILNYAKSFQTILMRESQLETQLFQLKDHPKKYIYVCAVKEYTNLNEALKELKLTRNIFQKQSLELINGETWILQTTHK